MPILSSVTPRHASAVGWAAQHLDVSDVALVSDSGWAATYCLSTPGGAAYLKIIPEATRRKVAGIVGISGNLQGLVPDLLGVQEAEGWLLSADHMGELLATSREDNDWVEVLARFGSIQAHAAGNGALLKLLDPVDPLSELPQLLQFLAGPADAGGPGAGTVGAAYFIGSDEAVRHARLLRHRAESLQPLLAAASLLPRTLSHGDLHDHNVALRSDGHVIFFDWDEAACGPAGLCLHGMFGGCALPAVLTQRLADAGSAGDSSHALMLQAYVNALVDGGYADRQPLLSGLIGSMSAGQMRFITSFGRYPGEQQRDAAADTIRARLSDLLDLCDWQASRTPQACSDAADDYERNGELQRAQRLVQDQLAREPQQPELLARYATLAHRLGDAKTADEAAREAHALAPTNTQACLALARASLVCVDLDVSRELIGEVQRVEPTHAEAQALLERVHAAASAIERAAAPDTLPCVAVSAAEQLAGKLEPDTLALLVHLFKLYGVVQVDNVFAPGQMAAFQAAFAAKYGGHFHDGHHADALQVGNKRYMLTMELDDTFGSEAFVASSLMLPVMQKIVGSECILSAYTAVISLPGSAAQTVHKDHSELFEEEGWHLSHPSFAAQIIVPLLGLNEMTGATRVFKGTQRTPLNRSTQGHGIDPVVPLGSCVLLDYSVAHYGMGNQSNLVRPILNLVYSRPWFRDCRNYHIQPPLRFTQAFLDNAPGSVKKLVAWWDLERRAAAVA